MRMRCGGTTSQSFRYYCHISGDRETSLLACCARTLSPRLIVHSFSATHPFDNGILGVPACCGKDGFRAFQDGCTHHGRFVHRFAPTPKKSSTAATFVSALHDGFTLFLGVPHRGGRGNRALCFVGEEGGANRLQPGFSFVAGTVAV